MSVLILKGKILLQFSKILAFTAALALANMVIYIGFIIAVFGRLDLFLAGVGLLNLLLCGLTFRAVFRRWENSLWTGLEFIFYGLGAVSARYIITDIALYPSGVLVLAGILALIGSRFAPKPKREKANWG